ncbi:MAG: ABC transporter ATP-binding protein/permease [Clostridia bacterium]|nr:ABC transporter ATP-binding protein/permease [Clostridia bacterium]
MLILKEIRKDYVTSSETVQALKGVSIAFRDKEFVSILGPSGCGKTTMLNIVGGLDRYTSGDLVINGRSTKKFTDRDWDVYRNHRVGFIFQSYNLIPHQTVLGNVELALTIAGIGKEERVARAKAALDKVGLSSQYYKKPNQLSGGQCQRVAIARALVNDPEILLADEPTGALDTVTSVQIMDLIKEIAKERLVIMVTHNPELAEEYSTRIIRLLDGEVQEDSNAPSEEEIAEAEAAEKEAQRAEAVDELLLTKKERRAKRRKKEKAKMSPITAFMLSAKNLLSKKGRTSLVGIAGSIGIIGIALVLAFSAGIKGYIKSMQDDMLSGNPITITESTLDFGALTGMVNNALDKTMEKLPGKVYVSSLVEYIIKSGDAVITNDISADYMKFVSNMPKEYYNAIKYDYGISMVPNIFVDFKATADSAPEHMSIKQITDIYKALLSETEQSGMSRFVDMLAPSLQQAPNNPDYILSQYNLLGNSKIATEKGEVMLVLNSEDELSDLLLARLGYFTEVEFIEIIHKANSELENKENGAPIEYDDELYRDYFSYDELLNKTLTWYPTDTIFRTETTTTTPAFPPNAEPVTKTEAFFNSSFETKPESGLELKVVGILTPKDNISFGALSSGIYYTEALTEYMLEANSNSEFISTFITPDLENSSSFKNVKYDYSYYKADAFVGASLAEGATKTSVTGASMLTGTAESLLRSLGGNKVPNGVSIYPISFDDKYLVTAYLDQWNDKELDLTVGDKTLTADDREDVTYTDTLEIIVFMINTMIDIISYALIAFTSVSLVVSTVMIGIITYVSVVERIKEIGVIRSLGGRKKDVSRLFTAETFIIGLFSGLFGILVSVGISAIASAIVYHLAGVPNIAALPVSNALFLIGLSVLLTLISGVLPARSAAKKDPVVALRTE